MQITFYLSEAQWSKAFEFFEKEPRMYVGDPQNLRRFVEACFWMLRGGAQWRLLPKQYGSWNAIFKRFNAWSKNQIWEHFFMFCAKDPDLEYLSIDSPIVRGHACSAGYRKDSHEEEALGRSRGGFSTKIHAKTDALGNPLKIILTKGNASDISQAMALTEGDHDAKILADKEAYKERHVIECFFGEIKHFRRVFSRFDKFARNFCAFVHLAAAHVWLR